MSSLGIRLTDRRARGLGLGLALAAVALGAALAFAGPVYTLAGLAALALGVWALTSLDVGLLGVLAVITLLPFGSLPFKIVFTPTFLDLAMLAVVGVYALQWMTGARRQLTLTPAHAPLAAFMLLAIFSFVAGRPNGPLTSNLIRQFGEMLLNIGFVFIIVDYVDRRERLERLGLWLVGLGALAAAIALVLYVLPPSLADRLLSSLRVISYPAGGVLRYIEDNPENAQRAIGTSVDPNMLGGLLAMLGGLAAPQLLAARRGWMRLALAGAFGLLLTGLVLTFSRGAMAALGLALAGLAVMRYRRLVGVMALAGLVILALPVTQAYVAHFAAGLQGQDLATQMRFGEYKDALILISRYPVFGVGFAGAPEIDVYLGVSSAYLVLAEMMGLVGLGVFGLAIASVMVWAWRQRRAALADPQLSAWWLGAHAGLGAALVVGVVDHYFFNLTFQPAGALFWIFVGVCLAATRLAQQQ